MAFPRQKTADSWAANWASASEWNANASIDWGLLEQGPYHAGLQRLVRDLNQFYQGQPALFDADYDPPAFFGLIAPTPNTASFPLSASSRMAAAVWP